MALGIARLARDGLLPDPRAFDAASQHVTEDDIAALVPCGPDTGQYVKAVREYVQAGFTHVALVQVGAERQHDFIDLSARELLPALRRALRSRPGHGYAGQRG